MLGSIWSKKYFISIEIIYMDFLIFFSHFLDPKIFGCQKFLKFVDFCTKTYRIKFWIYFGFGFWFGFTPGTQTQYILLFFVKCLITNYKWYFLLYTYIIHKSSQSVYHSYNYKVQVISKTVKCRIIFCMLVPA